MSTHAIAGSDHKLGGIPDRYAFGGGVAKVLQDCLPNERLFWLKWDELKPINPYPSSLPSLKVFGAEYIGSIGGVPLALVDMDGIEANAESNNLKQPLPERPSFHKNEAWVLALIAVLLAGWGWINLRSERCLPWSGVSFLVGMGL